MKLQMIGLCRYSYVGLRGYQVEHETFEERRAFLFDPNRLMRRWKWFTELALPSWRKQTDPDFTLVVMTSPDLPEPYLSGLQALADEIPQLRLEVIPPMKFHLPACRRAIAPHIDPQAEVIGHFRHDDDDAVAVDYIERARADFEQVKELWRVGGKLSLDHSCGLIWQATEGKMKFMPRICHNATAALTIFLRPEAEETALNYNHVKLAKWMPGVSVSDPPMFIRTIHDDNDSGDMGPGMAWDLEAGDVKPILTERFGLQKRDLRRLLDDIEALKNRAAEQG